MLHGKRDSVTFNGSIKKNQKLIITILDEFVEEPPQKEKPQTVRGMLAKYADPSLGEQEAVALEK